MAQSSHLSGDSLSLTLSLSSSSSFIWSWNCRHRSYELSLFVSSQISSPFHGIGAWSWAVTWADCVRSFVYSKSDSWNIVSKGYHLHSISLARYFVSMMELSPRIVSICHWSDSDWWTGPNCACDLPRTAGDLVVMQEGVAPNLPAYDSTV